MASVYRQRWSDRVLTDDFRYYAEEALISLEYEGIYAFRILASSLLVAVRQPTTMIDDLLDRHAFERQTRLKENMRLENGRVAAPLRRTAECVGEWFGVNLPAASGRLFSAFQQSCPCQARDSAGSVNTVDPTRTTADDEEVSSPCSEREEVSARLLGRCGSGCFRLIPINGIGTPRRESVSA